MDPVEERDPADAGGEPEAQLAEGEGTTTPAEGDGGDTT